MNDQEIIEWAERTYQQYVSKVARILGLPEKDIIFRVAGLDTNAAETSGTTITLDRDWFKGHPDDVGAIVHEMAHAFQSVPGGTASMKVIEGIADAVRSRVVAEEDQNGWTPDPEFRQLQNFLSLRPAAIRTISQAMAAGTYTEGDLARAVRENQGGNGASGESTPGTAPAAGAYGVPTDTSVGGNQFALPAGSGGAGQTVEEIIAAALGGLTEEEDGPTVKDYVASAQNMAAGWGIPWSDNLMALAQQGFNRSWTTERFINELRKTPDYRQAFPGIYNPDGTLKMSEAQYQANVNQYQSYASQAGVNLSEQQIGWLIRNDVLPSEYADRAPALGQLQRNPQLYQAFAKELVRNGVAKPGEVTKGELAKFIMGQGNRQWMELWNDTVTRNSAINAGVTFSKNSDKYLAANPGLIERISNKGLSESQLEEGWQTYARYMLDTFDLAKYQGVGLTRKDVAAAAFGGRGSAAVRQKIERVMGTDEAFWNANTANAQTFADAQGNVGVVGSSTQRVAQST